MVTVSKLATGLTGAVGSRGGWRCRGSRLDVEWLDQCEVPVGVLAIDATGRRAVGAVRGAADCKTYNVFLTITQGRSRSFTQEKDQCRPDAARVTQPLIRKQPAGLLSKGQTPPLGHEHSRTTADRRGCSKRGYPNSASCGERISQSDSNDESTTLSDASSMSVQ